MPDAGAGSVTQARDFVADRLRMIFDDSPLTVSIMLFNAAILAFVHRGLIDGAYLGLWLSYMALIGAGRVMLLAAYRRRRPRTDRESAPWLRRTLAGLFASGVGWGVGGVVLIALGPGSHKVFTAFVLGGMAAGALPTLARIFPVYAVFLVPTLVPVIGYFAVLGTEASLYLTAMGLVFLGFLVVAGRRQQATVLGALRVADENRSLVDHLTAQRREALQEKERVDRLNA
ncbi:MAG TPA: hypothetical protein ENO23_10460, partial [Alphaproteobacteria bacterium]|nr:hypothetical protein [Alphaproteobacteria bacterium]